MIGYRLKYNSINPGKDVIWRVLLNILLRTMLYIALEQVYARMLRKHSWGGRLLEGLTAGGIDKVIA